MVVGMGLNIQPLCALKQCTLRAQIDGIALSNTRNSRTNDRTLCLLLQCGRPYSHFPQAYVKPRLFLNIDSNTIINQ